MGKARGEEFADLLVKKRILGPEQVEEARGMAAQTGVKLQDALVKLNYCTAAEVMRCIAEHHSMPFVELKGVTVPTAVVELVPESVARENTVFPYAHENNALQIVMSDPNDLETIEKLRFILNKEIQ